MKYNPYNDEVLRQRRSGRPQLPADAKYRQQEQLGEISEDLEDDETDPNSKADAEDDDQAGDDEDAYHPITPQIPQRRKL